MDPLTLDELAARVGPDFRLAANVPGLERMVLALEAEVRGYLLVVLRARLEALGGDRYMPPAVRFAACPTCGAAAGRRCRAVGWPSHVAPERREPGTPVVWVHAARDRAANGKAAR